MGCCYFFFCIDNLVIICSDDYSCDNIFVEGLNVGEYLSIFCNSSNSCQNMEIECPNVDMDIYRSNNGYLDNACNINLYGQYNIDDYSTIVLKNQYGKDFINGPICNDDNLFVPVYIENDNKTSILERLQMVHPILRYVSAPEI